MPEEPQHGVSLEQYAGVTAALAEELPLAAVLEQEGIAASDWPMASLAWKQALCADARGEGALFAEYRARLVEAEDVLDRKVRPVGDDLGAWLAFLGTWSSHASPFQLLEPAGLHNSDVARLSRSWERRMSKSPELRKKAEDLANGTKGALPVLSAEPATLRPFPWTKPRPRDADAVANALPTDAVDPAFGVDRYAILRVELEQCRFADIEPTIARYGLDAEGFADLARRYKERMASDPALARDFRGLCEHARRARGGGARAEPPRVAPPEIEPRALRFTLVPAKVARRTAPAMKPRRTVLPFRLARRTASAATAPRLRPALPFAKDPAASAWTAELHADLGPPPEKRATLPGTDLAPAPHLPFAGLAPPLALTIEQHASMCVEIAWFSGSVPEVLARYGLTPAAREELDRDYERRLHASPELRARWQQAFDAYRAWLAATVPRP